MSNRDIWLAVVIVALVAAAEEMLRQHQKK